MSDGLDLSAVTFHNSVNVSGWPATADVTRLEFRPTGVHIEHSKREGPGCWPNFRPAGWDGDLQYTLWLFERINGQWHGAGGIQFWQDCDQNGGPPEQFAQNWFYDANRWGPMTGYQPAPGEMVGFMIAAGDQRGIGKESVEERSPVYVMGFPRSGDVFVPPSAPPVPSPPPAPEPSPAPPAPAGPADPPNPGPLPPVPPVLHPGQLAAISAGLAKAVEGIGMILKAIRPPS